MFNYYLVFSELELRIKWIMDILNICLILVSYIFFNLIIKKLYNDEKK